MGREVAFSGGIPASGLGGDLTCRAFIGHLVVMCRKEEREKCKGLRETK